MKLTRETVDYALFWDEQAKLTVWEWAILLLSVLHPVRCRWRRLLDIYHEKGLS